MDKNLAGLHKGGISSSNISACDVSKQLTYGDSVMRVAGQQPPCSGVKTKRFLFGANNHLFETKIQ